MRITVLATGMASAFGIAALPAVELGTDTGLTLSGYGEAFTNVGHRGANNWSNSRAFTPGAEDEGYVSFPSDLTLKLGYKYDDFTLRSDVIIASQDQYDGDNVLLEQMFVDWRANDNVTVRAGRWQNTWLGWEGFHTPELWRVNHSQAWDWNVTNHGGGPPKPFVSDGLGLLLSDPDSQVSGGVFLVDDVLGNGPSSTPIDKAAGASVAWKPRGVGRFEVGVSFDPKAADDGDGTSSNGINIDCNADITAFRSSGWFFAGEIQFHRHPRMYVAGTHFGNARVALAMANYTFVPNKLSLTLMIDYVQRSYATPGFDLTEYAVALLTRPREHVRFNVEVFYVNERIYDADDYGGAGVLLVELP